MKPIIVLSLLFAMLIIGFACAQETKVTTEPAPAQKTEVQVTPAPAAPVEKTEVHVEPTAPAAPAETPTKTQVNIPGFEIAYGALGLIVALRRLKCRS